MEHLHEKFCWYATGPNDGENGSPEARYEQIVNWASRARCTNPTIFDELSTWLMGSGEWM